MLERATGLWWKYEKGLKKLRWMWEIDRGSFNVITQGQGENCKSSEGMERFLRHDRSIFIEEDGDVRSGQLSN